MKICRVTGPIVSTVKHPTHVGEKILGVQPVDIDGITPLGSSFLAMDRVQAGEGDLVLVLREGNGARQLWGIEILPIRSSIIGIIDQIDIPNPEEPIS